MDIAIAPELLLAPSPDAGLSAPQPDIAFDLDAALAAASALPPEVPTAPTPTKISKGGDSDAPLKDAEPDAACEMGPQPPGNALPPVVAALPQFAPLPASAPPAPEHDGAQIDSAAPAPVAARPARSDKPSARKIDAPAPNVAASPDRTAAPETLPLPRLIPSAQTFPAAADAPVVHREAAMPVADPRDVQPATTPTPATSASPVVAIAAPSAAGPRQDSRERPRDQAEILIEPSAKGGVRMALDRPGFDPVGVTVKRTEDGATDLRIAVATPAARDLFAAALPSLADTLAARGVDVGQVGVDVGQTRDESRRSAPHDGADPRLPSAPPPPRGWVRSIAAARRAGFTAYA